MAKQALVEWFRRNSNVIIFVLSLMGSSYVVMWNSGRHYERLDTKVAGLQTQVVEIRGIIDKRDVTINGHEARLRDVEALRYSIDRIDKTIADILGKIGATDARLSKLEDLVKINEQVKINTGRIDRLENFMIESTKDRSAMNSKLDQIQLALEKLMTMHMQK